MTNVKVAVATAKREAKEKTPNTKRLVLDYRIEVELTENDFNEIIAQGMNQETSESMYEHLENTCLGDYRIFDRVEEQKQKQVFTEDKTSGNNGYVFQKIKEKYNRITRVSGTLTIKRGGI